MCRQTLNTSRCVITNNNTHINSRQKQKLLSGPEKIVKSAYMRSLAAKLKELPQVQAKLGKGAISDNKLYAMIAENEEKNNRVFYDN